jgi:putative membrane protein
MAKKITAARKKSILKGALAGLVGGIVGSGAKAIAEKIYPPRVDGQMPPPVLVAERFAGHSLSEGQRHIATQGIHWAFGALAGAVYGAAVELEPKAGAWRGAAFGLALNKMTHESLLPKAGLVEPTARQSTQQRQSEWVTHAIYGITTDLVRRLVRKGL